jgi:hypothetical protein
MYLIEIEWGGADLINLEKNTDRWHVLVNSTINFGVPKNTKHLLTSRRNSSFSRNTLFQGVINDGVLKSVGHSSS